MINFYGMIKGSIFIGGDTMFKIDINGENFEYRVEKKKRKTIGIRITQEGEVVVTSPLNVDDEFVRNVVLKKSSWILSKLKDIRTIELKMPQRELVTGESLLLLGREYEMEVIEDVWERAARVRFDNGFKIYVNPKLSSNIRYEAVKLAVERWMREKAGEVFKARTEHYSKLLGLFPKKIVIKDQRSVWGSCSSKGNINYNYRLVMAPLEIIDYIVVHELCHLKHPNHSKEYWDFVEKIIPDYSLRRDYLKENGRLLRI